MESDQRFNGGSDGGGIDLKGRHPALSEPPQQGRFFFARRTAEDERQLEKCIEVASTGVTQPPTRGGASIDQPRVKVSYGQ